MKVYCISYLSSTFPLGHKATEIPYRVLYIALFVHLSSTNPHCSLAIYGSINLVSHPCHQYWRV